MDKDLKNYLVKVAIYTTSDSGKDKTEKIEVLVEGAKDINDANSIAFKHMAVSGSMTFDIVSVAESKIAEVITTAAAQAAKE